MDIIPSTYINSDHSALSLTVSTNSFKPILENKIATCKFDDLLLTDSKFVNILTNTIFNFAFIHHTNTSPSKEPDPLTIDLPYLTKSFNPDLHKNHTFNYCEALIHLSHAIFKQQITYSTEKFKKFNSSLIELKREHFRLSNLKRNKRDGIKLKMIDDKIKNILFEHRSEQVNRAKLVRDSLDRSGKYSIYKYMSDKNNSKKQIDRK